MTTTPPNNDAELRSRIMGKQGLREKLADIEHAYRGHHETGEQFCIVCREPKNVQTRLPKNNSVPPESSNELEQIYDCTFCDGKGKCWNNKTEKYEQCGCVEKIALLLAREQRLVEEAELSARHDEITKANKVGIEIALRKESGWEELATAYSHYLDTRYEELSAKLTSTKEKQ